LRIKERAQDIVCWLMGKKLKHDVEVHINYYVAGIGLSCEVYMRLRRGLLEEAISFLDDVAKSYGLIKKTTERDLITYEKDVDGFSMIMFSVVPDRDRCYDLLYVDVASYARKYVPGLSQKLNNVLAEFLKGKSVCICDYLNFVPLDDCVENSSGLF